MSAAVIDRLDRADLLTAAKAHAATYGITVADLCGRTARGIARSARADFWRKLYESEAHLSYSAIARLFDRDPSTVIKTISPSQRVKNSDRCRERWRQAKRPAVHAAIVAMRVI